MMEFWLAPLDASRPHEIAGYLAWHARLMVFAWAFATPVGVLAARHFKVMPGQDWPRELDNLTWWHTHRITQYGTLALTLVAFALAVAGGAIISRTESVDWHQTLGFVIVALVALQVIFAQFRGKKGGPTDPGPDGSLRGDHYDMTPRRLLFEAVHKSLGYAMLAGAAVEIALGLWQANAPRWMAAGLGLWGLLLLGAFVALELRGGRVSTYWAIWGPDPELPGNWRG